MFTKLKETMSKELKESMMRMFHQINNINKEIVLKKKKQKFWS